MVFPVPFPAHTLSVARELVRRKAVMVMHHFYLRLPSSVSHLDEDFRRMLGDTDPGVMEGALVLFHQLVKVGWGRGGAGGRRAVWKGWRCVWSAPLTSATGTVHFL